MMEESRRDADHGPEHGDAGHGSEHGDAEHGPQHGDAEHDPEHGAADRADYDPDHDPAAPVLCEVCGAEMYYTASCKLRCPRCGYTRDCSDP